MFFIRKVLAIFFVLTVFPVQSQSKSETFLTPSDTLHIKRRNAVYISEAAVLGVTLIGLNQLWYKDYPKSSFHFINDNNEWLQMDKAGHLYTTYHMGRFGAEALAWSGADKKHQLIYGATVGFAFMTVVEVFDGFSAEWGASWGDVVANAAGTGLYVSQELLWKEQRVTPKFSFHYTEYADLRPNTLGGNWNEQILKDYNGQTYWLSMNLHAFAKESKIPKWFNIALGYGAEGMLYGDSESVPAEFETQNVPTRQFYLSLDVDLTRIKTNSHILKTLFSVFNTIKVPAPTLEINQFGDVKGYFIYF
ncbi:hypothetical protein FLJC2902T_06410 [Flavobacterium limnosediminis JC2902]|uniref:DUF2279 domain-containing protein n=1 Tax=Flavobacterium limnosediminis JC2902 TaxID=1341181 RepID=V6SXX3_9FLAO|nr:hypothetical protein FLJC2902T_06410 [Flavobacterium limnosediminis JC2902]